MSIISFKYRIKSGDRVLRRQAKACNQVWNFCVSTQKEVERRRPGDRRVRWPSAFDLINMTSGCSKELDLHSDTIGQICLSFVASRDQHRKCPRYRSSYGSRKALGWVPFRGRYMKIEGNLITYLRQKYSFWKSREIDGEMRGGQFVEDARGRWYVVLQCEVEDNLSSLVGQVGIDLGLSTLATLSDGRKIENLRHTRTYSEKLATAQKAGNIDRVRAIHAKIKNARHHHHHVETTKIVRENNLIVIGNVNSVSLSKSRLAKSVMDASWCKFRDMLRYKARRHGAILLEVDERYTSQTCSCCGSIPSSSPKGRSALGIRRWDCSECGASHDRDVNAALNILRVGLERQPPGEEIATVVRTLTPVIARGSAPLATPNTGGE